MLWGILRSMLRRLSGQVLSEAPQGLVNGTRLFSFVKSTPLKAEKKIDRPANGVGGRGPMAVGSLKFATVESRMRRYGAFKAPYLACLRIRKRREYSR